MGTYPSISNAYPYSERTRTRNVPGTGTFTKVTYPCFTGDNSGYDSLDDEVDEVIEAEEAWSIGKEIGLVADDENIVIQTLMEEYIEKKNGSRDKARKNSCGRKRAKAKKTGAFNHSP